jgi:diacylglycerol kinase (ATP)
MERWFRAAVYSWNGIVAAARGEVAIRQELIALALAVPLAFLVTSDPWKRVALVAVLMLVIVIELLNTAVEKLSDHVTPSLNPNIGRIKDMGSAAVALALLIAAMIWLVAIAERLALL